MEDRLSKQEEKLFRELVREKKAPAPLEQKIISQLKNEGLIKTKSVMRNIITWSGSIAAAILIFVGGMYYGQFRSTGSTSFEIDRTKGYMLILHESVNFEHGDPMAMFEEYGQWMSNTMAKGVKITGQELKNEAALVTRDKAVDFLPPEGVDRTTGYFLLEANSLEEAIAVAMENPHVKYGGSVEVKAYMVR